MSTAVSPWIISRRQDLTWFSGSALFGYLILLAAVTFGLPAKFFLAFAIMIDGPHVYSTFTRVVFDREERARLKLVWLIALPICLIGAPLLILLLGGVWFFVLVATVSHFHISKQHMGFVMIYKRKAHERDDFKLDKYFTLIALILPFLFYLSAVFSKGMKFLPVFLIPEVLLVGFYLQHQMKKEAINWPKVLVLIGFVPLQWAAWSFAAVAPESVSRIVIAGVVTNVGHSFQYLRLMFFHNHNRYGQRHDLLGIISRKWIYFMTAAVILASANLIKYAALSDVVGGALVGILFFHFALDSKIWRIRGNAELAKALNL